MSIPSQDKYPADAATMNTLYDALAGVVIALSDTMPPPHRAQFAANLARMAMNAEQQGKTQLETTMLALWRAASPRP